MPVGDPMGHLKGGNLHASHRALRANYIINSRPHAISAFDNRRRESRKSFGECSVQQRPISHRIFFICLPAVCLLVKRHRWRQSYRPCKENKRSRIKYYCKLIGVKHQQENMQSTRVNLDRESLTSSRR